MSRYRAEFFAGAILLGAALRVVAYPLPGSTDVPIFRAWSHVAASEGVGRLYGTGGHFPERRVLARTRVVPVLTAVSAIAALDMNTFYGLGVGVGWAVPRTLTGIDLMIVLAVAHVAALARHAAIASTPRASRALPQPA